MYYLIICVGMLVSPGQDSHMQCNPPKLYSTQARCESAKKAYLDTNNMPGRRIEAVCEPARQEKPGAE